MKTKFLSALMAITMVFGLTACEETADNNSSRTNIAKDLSTQSQDLTSESSFDDMDYDSSIDIIDVEKTLIDEYPLNDTTDVLTYYIDSENRYIILIDFKDYDNIDVNISNFMITVYDSFISEDMESFTVIATHDNNALMSDSYENKVRSMLGTFFLDANYEKAYNSIMNDDDSKNTNETPIDSTDTNSLDDTTIKDEKVLLYSDDLVDIYYDGIYELFGYNISLFIENKSNKNLIMRTVYSSINDFMVDDIFFCDIAAGEKISDQIIIRRTDLTKYEIYDIDGIKNIEFKFKIGEKDMFKYFTTDIIKIKP